VIERTSGSFVTYRTEESNGIGLSGMRELPHAARSIVYRRRGMVGQTRVGATSGEQASHVQDVARELRAFVSQEHLLLSCRPAS
jgi:hypothetical protein